MRSSRHSFAVVAFLALALPGGLAAQRTPPPPQNPTTTQSPVTPQTPAADAPSPAHPPLVALGTPVKTAQPKPKLDTYKGRVLVFNLAQILVQSTENEKMVWTFQYSVELRQHVVDLLNSGGYQYGDMVQVYCNPGTTVAVKIKGKPSKPI